MTTIRILSACAFWLVPLSGLGAETYFSFDATPNTSGVVGQGFSDYRVSPVDGWSIDMFTDQSGSYLRASIRAPEPDPDRQNYYWNLYFASPVGELLGPGLYSEVARYPFQEPGQAGFKLNGNHREDNTNGGFFNILQLVYNADGTVHRFAADWAHYRGGNPEPSDEPTWAVVGEIRYNFNIPEPTACTLALVALCVAFRRRR